MFQTNHYLSAFLIKKIIRGHFFHNPENGKARVYVQWTFFHEPENRNGFLRGTLIHRPENRKAVFVRGHFFHELKKAESEFMSGDIDSEPEIDSSTLNRSTGHQRTVPRIIFYRIISKISTNHSPFNRYKNRPDKQQGKRALQIKSMHSLSLFLFPITLIL